LAYSLLNFAQVAKLLAEEARRDAVVIFTMPSFDSFLDALVERGETEVSIDYIRTGWGSEDLKSESDDYLQLGQAFSMFGALPARGEKKLLALRHQGARFESEAENLAEEAAKRDPHGGWDESGE